MHPEIFYKRYKKAHYDMKTPNEAAFMSRAASPLGPSFPVLSDLHADEHKLSWKRKNDREVCLQ